MNINQRAVKLFEENQHDESLKLFQEAVERSRDVQSLTNLAWFYSNEENNDAKALSLLEETVTMNPASHFPYNLLGEVYLRQEKWLSAKDILHTAISIHPTQTAYHNLGVAFYHLRSFDEAAKYFLLASEKSDFARYSHVLCLIELGKVNEAKRIVDSFSESDDDFVGEVDLADLYVELGCHQEAIEWFAKGWNSYSKEPNWVSRYVYSLIILNQATRANGIIQELMNQKAEELKDASEEMCDEDWTERDKQEHINELYEEMNEYRQMIERISSGYVPVLDFDPPIHTACYLFGCSRHNHPEYQG
ncbi:tetratricopeptide repeat protein [Metabacillus idriensis]|uniref:tetratricopeptide repeat protein n=1 Tax=Metabacillus idriensis TaxID=324768 RepID=UPI00204091E3|nr:tetratricopeptide repeat protein [Metabacillus idriensis]MCM3597206.1 tetratricopeptide repeat protein [Metabacillus idriensis]